MKSKTAKSIPSKASDPNALLQAQFAQLGVRRAGDIGWMHGVNDRARLFAALNDPEVHYVEGDIFVVDGAMVMAHAPDVASHLLFEEWLQAIVAANKGAKLDFKSPAAVAPCLTRAQEMAAGRIPLMVNADIFLGPGGQAPLFDPDEFLDLCQRYTPDAVFSPGWTVGLPGLGYSQAMLDRMRDYLHAVQMPVTLSVHSWLLFSSWPEIKWLLDETPYTLTAWGKLYVPELLSWLHRYTNPERTFYDLQTPDGDQVHLTISH